MRNSHSVYILLYITDAAAFNEQYYNLNIVPLLGKHRKKQKWKQSSFVLDFITAFLGMGAIWFRNHKRFIAYTNAKH